MEYELKTTDPDYNQTCWDEDHLKVALLLTVVDTEAFGDSFHVLSITDENGVEYDFKVSDRQEITLTRKDKT